MQPEKLPKATISLLYDKKSPKHNTALNFFIENIIQIHNTTENIPEIEELLRYMITHELNEDMIMRVHKTLKEKTTRNTVLYPIGRYKKLDPYRKSHTKVEFIPQEMNNLLKQSRNTVIDNYVFFFDFLKIHPFFDGNGRTGRTITAMEMLKNGMIPFASILPQDSMDFKLRYIAYLESNFSPRSKAEAMLTLERTRPLTEKIIKSWFD